MWQKYSLSCVKFPPPSIHPSLPLSLIFTIFCSVFVLCPLMLSPTSLPPFYCCCCLFLCHFPPPHTHTFLIFFLSFFSPLRSVTIFPRRKYCSEPLSAEMLLLFQNPLGVENTCSSVLHGAEGNWINRSFFPTSEMK